MNIRIRSVILSVTAIFAAALLITAAFKYTSSASAVQPKVTETSKYTLRLEDDQLTVSKDGETVITGISVAELREQDRIALENGIQADTYEEILKLIEDFNS